MREVAKETRCTHCEHLPVCSLKEQFLAAQQAVDSVQVGFEDHSFQSLRNFDWIKPVELECIHFTKQRPTARDIVAQSQACSSALSAPGVKLIEGGI